MCEAVQEYAKEYAKEDAKEYGEPRALREATENVKKLMGNAGVTQEKAFDILEIQGEKRELVIKQLQQE